MIVSPIIMYFVGVGIYKLVINKVGAPLKWASAKLIHPIPKWSDR